MNIFITQSLLTTRFVALVTLFSLVLSALPASFFVAFAEEDTTAGIIAPSIIDPVIEENPDEAVLSALSFSGCVVQVEDGLLSGPVENTTTNQFFTTIQNAVNDCDTLAGNVIVVAAGTYAENVNVTKSLHFRGPNFGINPNTGIRVPEAVLTTLPAGRAFSISTGNTNVSINGFRFEGGSPIHDGNDTSNPRTSDVTFTNNFVENSNAIFAGTNTSWDEVQISRNKFQSITSAPSASAMQLNNVRNAQVINNVINVTNFAGVLLDGVPLATVSGNTITNTQAQAIQLAGVMGYTAIQDNIITNANISAGVDRGAIRLSGTSQFTGDVAITRNNISGGHNGIAVKNTENITGKVIEVFNNNITGLTGGVGVYNGGTGTLDAENNWWGSTAGIAGSFGVSDTDPWLCGPFESEPSSSVDGACVRLPDPQTQVKVHIYKYLQSGLTSAQIPNDSTAPNFPMISSWDAANLGGAGNGSYVLGNNEGGTSLKYAADTSFMDVPADYTTSEVTGGDSVVLPVDARCVPGKYRLVGYKQGDSIVLAESASLSTIAPVYTDITIDKYVIVVNEKCGDAELTPIINTCLIPNTLGDDSEFVINDSGEDTVAEMLALHGYAAIDTTTDQINYQVWNLVDPTAVSVTFSMRVLGKRAGNTQIVGYYKAGDTLTMTPVLTQAADTDGEVSISVTIPSAFANTFGFAMKSADKTWYSETALNTDGQDHVAVYNPSANKYLLAFEDINNLGDGDYNDMVIEIQGITCNKRVEEPNQCVATANLLTNGSFETPIVNPENDGWDVFDSVVNGLAWVVTWLNPAAEAPAVAKLELQDGRPASDGNQYAELDSNYTLPGEPQILGDARVKIAQTVPTVIGQKYTFTYDLSAIPGRRGGPGNNKVNVLVNGVVVATETADGRLSTTTDWKTYSYTFTATASSTEVALADDGRSNTFGTFVDNVSLVGCVPSDDGEDDGEDGGGDDGGGNGDNGDDGEVEIRRSGGGGGGTRVDRRAPTGEVLGSSTTAPAGLVLGDATSTLPVGAPNTGGGGTAPVTVVLPTLQAVLISTPKIRLAK